MAFSMQRLVMAVILVLFAPGGFSADSDSSRLFSSSKADMFTFGMGRRGPCDPRSKGVWAQVRSKQVVGLNEVERAATSLEST